MKDVKYDEICVLSPTASHSLNLLQTCNHKTILRRSTQNEYVAIEIDQLEHLISTTETYKLFQTTCIMLNKLVNI